ncbi:MAG: 50S ribosomal protein L15 [Nitrospinota bacterium]
MRLGALKPPRGAKSKARRVGRGHGSGRGETSGRGTKGQRARSGSTRRPGFEGGQMPLQRRLPKRGFTNIFRKEYVIVNLRDLARFEPGSQVTELTLRERGLVRRRGAGLKVLGEGELAHPLHVVAARFSASAKRKIEAAGGVAEVASP